jgi:uncharacterized protein
MSIETSVSSPVWHYTPMAYIYRVLALAVVVFAFLGSSTKARAVNFDRQDVSWNNGDVRLEGTVFLPNGSARVPAALFLHGSGQMGRLTNAGNRVLFNHAEWLASHGIAVLIYDKRGVGKSTGDLRLAGFDVLTADALGGLALLRSHPRVDPKRVGIIGLSQGGWLATQMIDRGEHLAFAIMLTAGPPVTPGDQEIFVQANRMKAAGAPQADIEAAVNVMRQAFAAYRSDAGWDGLKASVARLSTKPWFAKAPLAIASRDDEWWRWYASFMDYDPKPALAKLTSPLFVALGASDSLFDLELMQRAWLAVAAQPAHDVALHVYPNAGHALRSGSGTEQPAQYWTDLDNWLTEKGMR